MSYLHLADKTKLKGVQYGSSNSTSGEVVFSTGMTGYVETFTDPSFAGQILVCTYPLIGNYGVPDSSFFESKKIHLKGVIVSELALSYSHSDAHQSIDSWLKKEGVPLLAGIDTRALTKKLREHGAILGAISSSEKPIVFDDPNTRNLVADVSPSEVTIHGDGPICIIAIDCGMKENIVRSLTRPNVTLKRVPWNYDIANEQYDALFISNGPGDPTQCSKTVHSIKNAMKQNKPILGICLGNQLLALAAGGATYKLSYGHRGQNQPCIDTETGRCYITSQNHGFAVKSDSLPEDWKVWFTNANDNSVEGIKHTDAPWRSVQFHPEAAPGPTDTAWIFDEFLASLQK
ncbi:carbamoyl-phosphate synthase (glutamine-hydrolyzing) small subunit [bacterium]|nr:carbamoyl-phosphate synthase (glutamine-hydrolyzing) small subunit [bacterium]